MNKVCFKKLFLCTLMLAFGWALSGCATNATVSGMTVEPAAIRARSPHKKLQHGIALQDVKGGKETNPVWTSQISNDNFKVALADSFKNAGFDLADSKNAKYILTTTFKKVDQPLFGLNFKISTTINYVLVEKATNKIIFNKDVKADYTAKFGDALYGVKRLRLANEGSAKQNISQFISSLSTLNPDKVSVHIK